MDNKRLIRAFLTVGVIATLGYLMSQTLGLGAGGFDNVEEISRFNFYTTGGIFLILALLFFIAKAMWKGDDEYGNSICFVSQGEFPSLGIFKKFSTFRLFLGSLIIFLIMGIVMVSTQQKTLTGLRVLPQQFTPVESATYSALLIPISENAGVVALIGLSILVLTLLALRFDWKRNSYRVLVLLGIPFIVGTYGFIVHLLRYGSSEVAKQVVFIFWTVGGFITVLVGSWIPFLVMHLINNLLFDLQRFISSDVIRIYMFVLLALLVFFYVYLYHIRKPKNQEDFKY